MATLALAAVGAAAGSALLPAGISFLGATLTGAAIGAQIGALAGSYVDQALFAPSHRVEGPRLKDLHVTSSTEGAHVPRIYGAARIGGQLIWATDFEEVRVKHKGGGKGGFGGGQSAIEYKYYANFAVALCEGEITGLGRVWADGREIDLSGIQYRVHNGGETQAADSLIVAREGLDNAPAYRGIAYVVFERLDLAPFGNRVPQLSFEVFRAVEPVGEEIRGVVVIPGSGEFVYATTPVDLETGIATSRSENVHTRFGGTDWKVSIDQLEDTLPNARAVSLVVSWFGTDLRAGNCQLKPGVEGNLKQTSVPWRVNGIDRADAYRVSSLDGRPAYGGTPSDSTVIDAIRDLKSRGFHVTLTPFILMDVAEGNALPNPYGGASQPGYPWRGRITCHPAAGRPGTVDKTPAAAAQIASFVGTALPTHFAIAGGAVIYSGPAEWSFRRMVLHHAWLAKAAGGVDAFLIGTELRGLTWVRSAAATYPFVTALMTLAADVKSVLGPATKVTYAADWSEYFGHQPPDGTGDVYFHLDPLWASASIDAIGIDLYWPLADWRDGTGHLDYQAGARSIHDLAYLKGNVAGGEGFDWYYASQADRDAQVRTPITDGAGKPWVFRYKDIKSWWQNAHYNRPGGVESAVPTAWVPQSKPFWLMEVGCGAVDKGANQPNVFVDPKSSENALPYYSNGTRDDLMQRRFNRALIEAFDPAAPGYVAGANPNSAVYGGPMVSLDRIHVYAWDARPYPAFPFNTDVWGDGDNWRLGHWLNGRGTAGSLGLTISRILDDFDFTAFDVSGIDGVVPGYVIDRVMSARDALAPLELGYFFDAVESGGLIEFRPRGGTGQALEIIPADLVEQRRGDALMVRTRAQETELPAYAKINHIGAEGDYRQAVAESRRLTGGSTRIASADLAIVLEPSQAQAIADSWLFDTWAARERATFALPPSTLALEPGDVVRYDDGTAGGGGLYRVTEIGEAGRREIEARALDPEVFGRTEVPARPLGAGQPVLSGKPEVLLLDLPLISGNEPPSAGYMAALQVPWPGTVALLGAPQPSGFVLKALATTPAILGRTLTALKAGPEGRIDRAARVRVEVAGGELQSVTRLELLAGENIAAVRNADGEWEVVQFETAELVGAGVYELSGLLRGQGGTETAMRSPVAAGAPFVLIDGGLAEVGISQAEIGLPLYWKAGPASRDIGDVTYRDLSHTFRGQGLRPLSPVHIRGDRALNGDLTIGWIRRTRLGGDTWETPEVALSEETERYEVEVLQGATVKRVISATSPSVLYTAALQAADFGAPQAMVTLRIYQLSAAIGRGAPRTAVV